MSWLTPQAVRDDVQSKVRELTGKIDGRHAVSADNYESEVIARVVGGSLAAGLALKKEWFFSSVGIDWGDGDRETWYVSRAPVAATFATDNVIHWTHWIGRLCTQIREYLEEHGRFPALLTYGPPQRQVSREVGPLVRYQFTDGRLVDHSFHDARQAPALAVEVPEAEPVRPPAAEAVSPSFGLKDIVELRDLAQDDQIRGPMAGIYILTGGPGVGKTSVALHRIPYLLLEQVRQLPHELPSAPRDFFSAETMHVVVWKQHLVPYLQRCLQDLSFGSASVYHVEDWVARTLRDYVRIGRGKNEYQIVDEPDEMVRMKLGFSDPKNGHWTGLTESMLETHLTGRDQGRFNNPAGDEMVAQVQEQVAALENLFQGTPLSPRFSGSVARFVPTVGGIESAIQELRGDLDRLAEEVTEALRRVRQSDRRPFEQMRPVITRARELVTALRERLIDRLTADYAVVLSGFYKSSLVAGALRHRFGDGASERFVRDACGRLAKGRLSKCDRYLLLWLIHILTRGGAGANRGRPLRQYSHTVIDEAQYYHPLVLRLLVDLAKAPLRSVTIVGDLEQRVSNEGGLVGWEEAGIKAEHSKVFRLNTNYRWSKAVFGFLDVYRRLTGLRELKEPRRWASGAGLSPTITHCGSEDDQVEWLIDRVSTLRRTDWSIATVVPSGLGAEWRDRVIAELASCDIRSRWAVGEDVRECEEQVILTDYDSIVGLEFDAVLLPGCERVLPPPKPGKEGVQAAWVALTRARQYVGVGHVAPIAVFDAADFNPYRLHYNRDRT